MKDEIQYIRHVFSKLGYPYHILDKALHLAKRSYYDKVNPRLADLNKRSRIVVPYVPCLEAQASTLKLQDFELVFRYNNKISSFLSRNNSSPPIGGVYSIPCSECDKIYFGETGRELFVRVKEHKQDVMKLKPESAIASHSANFGHSMSFDLSKILFMSNNLQRRHIVESALIALHSDHALNNNSGFSPHNLLLSKFLASLIPIN